MKKTVLFAVLVAMLILCVSLISACNRRNVDKGRNGDSSTVTDGLTVTLPPDDGINIEDAKLEALRILTPRASDKEPIMDGIVHCYRYGHGHKPVQKRLVTMYDEYYDPNLPNDNLGQLFLMRRTEDNSEMPEIMCNVEGCKHKDLTCPAVIYDYSDFVLPVTDEKTGRTVVYTAFGFDALSIPIWGKSVNLLKEFGLPEEVRYPHTRELHVIMEYDLETGERRAVAVAPFLRDMMFLTGVSYYNGRLYFSLDGWSTYEPEYYDDHPRMVYVDVASGEVKFCEKPDGEPSYFYFAGIYEDNVYCLSEAGEFMRMNLDFSEREIWGKIDNFATTLTFENGSGTLLTLPNRCWAFIDGYLYIETLDSELVGGVIYKIPLNGEWKPEVVPGKAIADVEGEESLGIYKEDKPEGIDYYFTVINNEGFWWLHRPTEKPTE